SGRRSLRILFSASTQVEFHNVSQLVAVEPSTHYRLTYFVRTEELRSAATLIAMAADASSPDTALASSAPVPSGTNEWQQVSFEFNTGPKTEAALIRLVRAECPEGPRPIYGQ